MLKDIPTPTLREASSCVLETERLMLRRPTLADVKAIAHLANDRRIAENTRRLPHPYSQDHAIEFVRAIADNKRETVFLIRSEEHTSELQSRQYLVCRLLLEKKKNNTPPQHYRDRRAVHSRKDVKAAR